jgi:hypothetical protein
MTFVSGGHAGVATREGNAVLLIITDGDGDAGDSEVHESVPLFGLKLFSIRRMFKQDTEALEIIGSEWFAEVVIGHGQGSNDMIDH